MLQITRIHVFVVQFEMHVTRMIMGVTENGVITAIRKDGGGSLHPTSISDMLDVGRHFSSYSIHL